MLLTEISHFLESHYLFGIKADYLTHAIVAAFIFAFCFYKLGNYTLSFILSTLAAFIKELIDWQVTHDTFQINDARNDFIASLLGAGICACLFYVSSVLNLQQKRYSLWPFKTHITTKQNKTATNSHHLPSTADPLAASSNQTTQPSLSKKIQDTDRKNFAKAVRVIQAEKNTPPNTILLVDDDLSYLNALAGILRRKFNVEAASTPQQAIEIAAAHSIQLLITDFIMPEMNGVELVTKLREKNTDSSFPAIILTGMDDNLTLTVLKSLSNVVLLEKSGNPNDLLQEIDKQIKFS